jgi:hypothetical protein
MTGMHYTVMNASGAMLCVNLDTKDERGRRAALTLMARERSRPLTEPEFASSEVQKLLATGDLRDMTLLEANRSAAVPANPPVEPTGEPPLSEGEDRP